MWWVLPESSSDLASQALSFGPRGPFFGYYRNMMTSIKQRPSGGKAYDASSNDQKIVGGLVWIGQPGASGADVVI
ncbi:hypothetical protein INS49_013499 [Diaporthe citri]|uniref:uncharacterized protein n=1 Tax=Diaporthe citri TaxID=83186 RepID=UPI001C7FC589|nr:uncharacterized protein INS49_013499 [Diaporthe citri]KAG6357622.1 hypothetical protein INS49_013499 [Diaporthe citri]